MKLPRISKTSTYDVRLDPQTGAPILTVNGKDTPAGDEIFAAFKYDPIAALEYAQKQGASINFNGWRAAKKGAFDR